MDMKGVIALAPNRRAVVSRQCAVGAASIKGHSADAAQVIVDVPLPYCYSMPPGQRSAAIEAQVQVKHMFTLKIGSDSKWEIWHDWNASRTF
jgi:hypothetical protein